ncbi:iron-sulfur cluster assembly protein [Lichenihabitans psoromatis]|uniref:iron-sulfur cluster assembly protein n=1 Tax=Lichenihabitans psoromatis TaxID=2528642 RepID=UPI0013F1524D|nr:iron-sulfur cluster assembly protein [Lichenihabitans psoromatis]
MLRPEAVAEQATRDTARERRRADVMVALGDVLDPELDEPVTDMGFVERIDLADDAVEIVFRLPTYWCSANFAFLMATDMKVAAERLPWVREVTVRLVDHFAARKINHGVAAGQGFAEVFSGEAETNLDEIRRVFRDKAYLGRQERLLRLLVGRWGLERALLLTLADLRALVSHDDGEIRALALRYLGMRLHDGGATDVTALAFTALNGTAVTPLAYPDHLRALRRVRGAADANAEMCRLLLQARLTHPAPGCGIDDREEDTA